MIVIDASVQKSSDKGQWVWHAEDGVMDGEDCLDGSGYAVATGIS